jgi:hypothetical protein
MGKHSPLIALAAARREYEFAESQCPHWSYEGFDANEEHECCRDLADAQARLSKARKAAREG